VRSKKREDGLEDTSIEESVLSVQDTIPDTPMPFTPSVKDIATSDPITQTISNLETAGEDIPKDTAIRESISSAKDIILDIPVPFTSVVEDVLTSDLITPSISISEAALVAPEDRGTDICRMSEAETATELTGDGHLGLSEGPELKLPRDSKESDLEETQEVYAPVVDGEIADRATTWRMLEPTDNGDVVGHECMEDLGVIGRFRILGASRRGKGHAHEGKYREDAFALIAGDNSSDTWWFAAVSDGAGSCRLSRVGARIATARAAAWVKAQFQALAPAELMRTAISEAIHALDLEAKNRACEVRDLSCTLLCVLWVQSSDSTGNLFTFQAGDGLIAEVGHSISPVASGDSTQTAGETHFLTGQQVRTTLTSRFSSMAYERLPDAIILMSDGVSDDLIPLSTNGPILAKELEQFSTPGSSTKDLMDLLAYEKRGSFDDRTLVVAALVRAGES